MKDYNEANIENAFRLIKQMHAVVCKWGECTSCNKRMQDVGFGYNCYECKKKGTQNEPFNINEVTGF